jgi:hypothetical protein
LAGRRKDSLERIAIGKSPILNRHRIVLAAMQAFVFVNAKVVVGQLVRDVVVHEILQRVWASCDDNVWTSHLVYSCFRCREHVRVSKLLEQKRSVQMKMKYL